MSANVYISKRHASFIIEKTNSSLKRGRVVPESAQQHNQPHGCGRNSVKEVLFGYRQGSWTLPRSVDRLKMFRCTMISVKNYI